MNIKYKRKNFKIVGINDLKYGEYFIHNNSLYCLDEEDIVPSQIWQKVSIENRLYKINLIGDVATIKGDENVVRVDFDIEWWYK